MLKRLVRVDFSILSKNQSDEGYVNCLLYTIKPFAQNDLNLVFLPNITADSFLFENKMHE